MLSFFSLILSYYCIVIVNLGVKLQLSSEMTNEKGEKKKSKVLFLHLTLYI